MALPVTLTGNDFARNYLFTVAFYESPDITWSSSSGGSLWDTVTTKLKDKFKDVGSSLLTLMNAGTMLYVGSLARKVTLPDPEMDTESVTACGIHTYVPKQMKFNTFSIEFLDDLTNTVYNFLHGWLLSARDGLAFHPLYQDTLSVVVCPVVRNATGLEGMLDKALSSTKIGSLLSVSPVEIPTGVHRFPHIYPVKVTRTPFDREGGNALSTVEATFIRLPSLPGSGQLQDLVKGAGALSFKGGFLKEVAKSIF